MRTDEVLVVNEQDEVIGTAFRAEAHRRGLLHRIAVIYVRNKNGEILVQRRADGRLDHSAAGHVDGDESYHDAAVRELAEELGISHAPLTECFTAISEEYDELSSTHIRHIYRVFECVDAPMRLNPDEVQAVHWEDPARILAAMRQDPDIRHYAGGFRASLAEYMRRVRTE